MSFRLWHLVFATLEIKTKKYSKHVLIYFKATILKPLNVNVNDMLKKKTKKQKRKNKTTKKFSKKSSFFLFFQTSLMFGLVQNNCIPTSASTFNLLQCYFN